MTDANEYWLCAECLKREVHLAREEGQNGAEDDSGRLCHLCLGMFSDSVRSAVAASAASQAALYSDAPDFVVSMHIPNSTLFRRLLAARSKGTQPTPAKGQLFVQNLADAARSRYGEILEAALHKKYSTRSDLTVFINFGHDEIDEADTRFLTKHCATFKKLKSNGKPGKRGHRRFVAEHGQNRLEGKMPRSCLDACVSELSESAVAGFAWAPSTRPLDWLVSLSREPLILGARYAKLSRRVPHSLGFFGHTKEDRETEEASGGTTVEEQVCGPLKALAVAEAFRFTSSGREDADTRMLGAGRPFAAQLLNPKRVCFDEQQLAKAKVTMKHTRGRMLVWAIWLSQRRRGQMAEAIKWLQLVVFLAASLLGAVAYRDLRRNIYLTHGQMDGNSFEADSAILMNTMCLSVSYVFGSITEILSCFDLGAPNHPTAGTLRFTSIAHKYLSFVYISSALGSALGHQIKLFHMKDDIRHYMQLNMRLYADGLIKPAAVHEVNSIQMEFRCCGMAEEYEDDATTSEWRNSSLAIWIRGPRPVGRRWDVPWSCCNATAASFCHHERIRGPSEPTVYKGDCVEAIHAELTRRYLVYTILYSLIGVLSVVSSLLSRYVKTSLWAAVWWGLDYERTSPGFLFQLDLLRSRFQHPAFRIATLSSKAQRRRQKLRRHNSTIAELTTEGH